MKFNSTPSQFLRASEAANYLGISESTFWRWVHQGRLSKGTRLSIRCTVWPREALEDFVARQAAAPARKGA